jgi:hypothetical protein
MRSAPTCENCAPIDACASQELRGLIQPIGSAAPEVLDAGFIIGSSSAMVLLGSSVSVLSAANETNVRPCFESLEA